MNKIPMLAKFAAQSLVEHDGKLIFSKEKFAELIVRECANRATWAQDTGAPDIGAEVLQHFGIEE